MPIYEYAPCSGECFLCNGALKLLQGMNEPAHTTCPYCRQDVERRLSVPQRPIMSRKDVLKDANVRDSGFAKYVKAEEGRYELAAGSEDAPKVLHRDTMAKTLQALEKSIEGE